MAIQGRTDLACEVLGSGGIRGKGIEGVRVEKESLEGFELLSVSIDNAQGSAVLGKPPGHYYTLHLSKSPGFEPEEFSRGVSAIARLIKRCIPRQPRGGVLIAALGNPDITPDAIGPLTAGNILVTKHLKDRGISGFEDFSSTLLCRTGVLGTTGIESAEQIRCLCESFRPELVIAVDALAGAEVERLCRTVQICDSGISPGSGVGNDRQELSEASLGVPVIALGVPTVIDAASICDREGLEHMFVTPRDIDSLVRSAGRLLGYGINMALHPGLEVEDMELLLG